MAGLKELGTTGTSDCVVLSVHILVVGGQELINHISTYRFLSHVLLKASTAPLFYVHWGARPKRSYILPIHTSLHSSGL